MKVYQRDGAKFYAIGFLLLFAIFLSWLLYLWIRPPLSQQVKIVAINWFIGLLSAKKTKEAGRLLKKATICSTRSIGEWA